MKSTYISRPIHLLDVPVPSKPRLKFEYNFFEADERVSEVPPRLGHGIAGLSPREVATKIPRLIRVSWSKVRFDPMRSVEVDITSDFVSKNSGEIANESSILNDTTLLYFQDFDHLNRIGERFEASARMRGVLSGSSTDVAARLNDVTIDATDGNTIQRYLSVASQSRSLFIQGDTLVEPVDASAAEQLAIIVDNDYIVSSSREVHMSPVGSAASAVRRNSRVISKRLNPRRSKFPIEDEIELELASVSDEQVNSPGAVSKVEHLGYIIERYEILPSDVVGNKKTIFIRSPKVSSYLDLEVKYGTQYVYSVRSLASFYVITASDRGGLQRSRFLVSSRPSTFTAVRTEEYIPPAPPADLNFHWDFQRASLQIDWSFPTNPQRDIKGWQVFRRASTDEAFSLIAYLDFDDSIIRTPLSETIDASLITKFKSSTTFHIEHEFNKDSNYIYAVCSVDAHGMTSNYSSQFRVTFDRIKNRLIKSLISSSGAPKQYPNTFLRAELSLDSVKSSKSQRVRVYFDPEYLQVTDNLGRDMKLLKTQDRNGLYRFMFLNTDRQAQANIDVNLEDLRSLRLDGSSVDRPKSLTKT
jgi:hypothetical protein